MIYCISFPSRFSDSLFQSTMSDSSDDNLSDLEEQQAVASGDDSEDKEQLELKGILNDVEETSVSWKDLVRNK